MTDRKHDITVSARTVFIPDQSNAQSGRYVFAYTITITNTGTVPVYARLGDAFNSATEQQTIFAAQASDGRVERQAGDAWLTLPGAHLIEGFKTVVLMPGRSYELQAPVPGPRITGLARIRITWFDDASAVGTGTPHQDVSNTFELR